MNLPEAKVTLEKNSPYGFMQLVTSPALRFAPGLSLKFNDTIAATDAIFNNGDWFGPINHHTEANTHGFLDYTTLSLPYNIWTKKNVLILESGTGYRVRYALSKNVPVDITYSCEAGPHPCGKCLSCLDRIGLEAHA